MFLQEHFRLFVSVFDHLELTRGKLEKCSWRNIQTRVSQT